MGKETSKKRRTSVISVGAFVRLDIDLDVPFGQFFS
jgi:hypothetical protein